MTLSILEIHLSLVSPGNAINKIDEMLSKLSFARGIHAAASWRHCAPLFIHSQVSSKKDWDTYTQLL